MIVRLIDDNDDMDDIDDDNDDIDNDNDSHLAMAAGALSSLPPDR